MTHRTGDRLTILVDDRAAEGLASEHGLSVWIEIGDRRILFDTGQATALFHNAPQLGIDLSTVETLVLSHGHYDHTGGLAGVLEAAPDVQVVCHRAVEVDRYSIRGGRPKPIHMPAAARAAMATVPRTNLRWATEATEIAAGIGVTGPIPRHTSYEDTGGPFFLDPAGTLPDPIDDDMALWIETSRGLVVVVGCSHAGVVNTLNHVRDLTGGSRIHTVLGGFHLLNASRDRVDQTIRALASLGLERLVPCHCTGHGPIEEIKRALGELVCEGRAGSTFRIER